MSDADTKNDQLNAMLPAVVPPRGTMQESFVSEALEYATSHCNAPPEVLRELVGLCEADSDFSGEEVVNTDLDLMGWYVRMNASKDGEILPRVTIICHDGATVTMQSQGAGRELTRLVAMYGPGPWKPGEVKVKMTKVSCKPGEDGKPRFTWRWVTPVDRAKITSWRP